MPQVDKDIFLGLTETGWIAIGSIVSAASIVVLSILNRLALKAAQRAADAAVDQAKAANATLEELKKQAMEQKDAQKANAIELLSEVARNAQNWRSKLSVDHQGEVKLFPGGWVGLVIFASQQLGPFSKELYEIERQIAETEKELVTYMHKSPIGRKEITTESRTLQGKLETVHGEASRLAEQLRARGN